MKGDMVQKRKFLADGEELEGLISIDQYSLEEGTVEVAGYNKVISVKNGVTTIPPIGFTFKITRNSKTMKILQDWKNKNEYKDCVMILTDGAGAEMGRELWPNVECSKLSGPAYDASSPVTASIATTLLPEDIIPIDPE